MIDEVRARRVIAAIVLTNNCTDTDWFLAAQSACDAICFTRGRISFTGEYDEKVRPTQGQAFFYFGPDIRRFASVFSRFGFGVVPLSGFDQPQLESIDVVGIRLS